jgi:LysR family transcriptional regulator, low CO2-responsive transcriptional regulator
MNLKQLEVFLAVAESGSFSKGAEATFITQSTVSQHIAALEQELGIRLLDRTAKGTMPTEGGKILLNHARRIMAEIRGIPPSIDRFKGIEDASLTVGASNIPCDYMIPEAMSILLGRFPSLSITVLHGDSREIMEKIVRQEVEIGVVGSCYCDLAYSFTPFGRDRIVLVVGQGHPWRNRRSVTIEELRSQLFISREPGSGTGKAVCEAMSAIGIDTEGLKVRVRLGSNEGVKKAVARGIGVSFISELSVHSELERGELFALPVTGLEITRQFYLASRTGREPSPAAKAFAGCMLEIYG